MAEDTEQSSESLSTSEEFEIVAALDTSILMTESNKKPFKMQTKKNEESGISQVNEKDSKQDPAILERSDSKQLKLEVVTDHPLAHSEVSISSENSVAGAKKLGTDSLNLTNGNTNGNAGSAISPNSLEDVSLSRSSSLQFAETDCSLFPQITYLGCAVINAPRSEMEIQRNMTILNEQALEQAIEITLSVPSHSEGCVTLLDTEGSNEIASFLIHSIMFCARGRPETAEKECFAFACSHGESAESSIFHCHVFKCDSPETVVKLLQCFAAAFHRVPKFRTNSIGSERNIPVGMSVRNNQHLIAFEAVLDIKEEDLKGNFVSCPREKDYFKLRCNLEKMITMTISQISTNKELQIQHCFGFLLTPGRNLDHSDMQALEGVLMNKVTNGEKTVYHISANWNPIDPVFEILNTTTHRDSQVYLSVAVDLVFGGIEEPTRFVIETKAKVFLPSERFWSFSKKVLHDQFYLRLKEIDSENGNSPQFEVVSLENSARKRFPSSWKLSSSHRSSEYSIGSHDRESESDNDEPLPSGTGEVSKECAPSELVEWDEVLQRWRQNLKQRPKALPGLVRRGVPEALRGAVWQLLAGCIDDQLMAETYKNLIAKESNCSSIIQRDINRTFPAHEHFKESGGMGQDSLYKICKAYSVYDPEIGYCQGQSFLAAALLLHMPEEQAFSILVKIMFEYKLRDMFKNGFEELHLRLYQLEKLIEDQLPELHAHFTDLGIEMHMFASQWFLTLFTAKFPLVVVFYILDIFLLDGIDILFQVAVALLMMSKKDLLALDFEGILKYFRVSLPKKYRTEESARLLLSSAVNIKVKKLKKYSKEYSSIKVQQKLYEDPVTKLRKENSRYQLNNLRLEHENDDLANELINIKSQLGGELNDALEKIEAYFKENSSAKKSLQELEEEKRRLETEVSQLKELCRRELHQAESEITRNNAIISEYKQICSQLNSRLEKEQKLLQDFMNTVKNEVATCENCTAKLFTSNTAIMKQNCNIINGSGGENACDEKQIRELELELAQTKLALVEAECKNQDLIHQLNNAFTEIQASKNTWLHKTWSSLKDATKKEANANAASANKESI